MKRTRAPVAARHAWASASRIVSRATAVVVLVLAAGCITRTQVRWYSLDPAGAGGAADLVTPAQGAAATRTGGGRSADARAALLVGRISVPEGLDRNQWVIRTGARRMQVLEGERWIEPLGNVLQHAIARRLVQRLPQLQIAVSSDAVATNSPVRLAIDVLAFETTPGEGTLLLAAWAIQTDDGRQFAHRSSIAQAVSDTSYDALAAAHARALDAMSDEIAATVRALRP